MRVSITCSSGGAILYARESMKKSGDKHAHDREQEVESALFERLLAHDPPINQEVLSGSGVDDRTSRKDIAQKF